MTYSFHRRLWKIGSLFYLNRQASNLLGQHPRFLPSQQELGSLWLQYSSTAPEHTTAQEVSSFLNRSLWLQIPGQHTRFLLFFYRSLWLQIPGQHTRFLLFFFLWFCQAPSRLGLFFFNTKTTWKFRQDHTCVYQQGVQLKDGVSKTIAIDLPLVCSLQK